MRLMAFFKALIQMLIMVIVVLSLYNILKIYVLEHIKANKWVVLILAAMVFLIPNIVLGNKLRTLPWLMYIQNGVFLILFLWFMDLAGLSNRQASNQGNKNSTAIKAKAKPNRINKNNMEVIKAGKKKKK
ncbi:MAG: DUF2304 domain-containing protein [Clostridium sp.]